MVKIWRGKDHKNIWLDTTFGKGGEDSISFSRLISHTNAFFLGGDEDIEKVLKKRQTLAQLTLMTPGGYSGGWQGFGSVPTRDVDSTKHGGLLGRGTGGIHKSDGGKATGTGNKLDAYSFISYGDIGSFEGEQTGYVVDGSFTKARVSAQKLVDLTKSVEIAEKLKWDKWDEMLAPGPEGGMTEKEVMKLATKFDSAKTKHAQSEVNLEAYKVKLRRYGKTVKDIGNQGAPGIEEVQDSNLGNIKKGLLGTFANELTDKVNMVPSGENYPDGVKDFIKFKFRDVINGKWIIFRAILNSVSDSITPEYAEERYVGRPDKVYVYQGADREISFNFSVYPKTKQELPVIWDKLNYLVGLCYPGLKSLGAGLGARMISPFIQLTIGDMFNDAAGILSSLSINVEDNTTWEIDEGLQLPKYVTADCTFKYIGNNILSMNGFHYDHKRITFPENEVVE